MFFFCFFILYFFTHYKNRVIYIDDWRFMFMTTFYMEGYLMIMSVCLVEGEVIDFSLSDKAKEVSDFNKSLTMAGFPFWKKCQVESKVVENKMEAAKFCYSYPLSDSRNFSTISESILGIEEKKHPQIRYCPDCGHICKFADNFCSICGLLL